MRDIILVCLCGTIWDREAIESYNNGSIEFAANRHRQFWKTSDTNHKLFEVGKEVE